MMLSSILLAYFFGVVLLVLIIFTHLCSQSLYTTIYFHHIGYIKELFYFIKEKLFSSNFFECFLLLCFVALPLILETSVVFFYIFLVDTYLKKLSILDILIMSSIPSLLLLLRQLPSMPEKLFYLQGSIAVDENIEVTPIFTCILAIGLIAGFLTAKSF
ncbi:hypothetical protein IQ250_17930 [Pseudanabaenaceae cyanobacterium LEGE 13415]|nr:hypothetical protein [Pseudanabaenaceae cyanobacterium LEGE 13415]